MKKLLRREEQQLFEHLQREQKIGIEQIEMEKKGGN